MQIICDGLDLGEAVITVSRAIAQRTTNPILEGIKLVADDESLTLSATDLQLSIEKKIKAEVKVEGEVVVPGKFFGELIKKLTEHKIELKLDENNLLSIVYNDSETVVQCFPSYEFPSFKKLNSAEFFGISKSDLKSLINKTSFAVAVDDTRPILKGCLLEIESLKVSMIALDGSRLAMAVQKIKENNLIASIVVPSKSLNEISKLLDESDEIINIYVQESFLMVDLKDCIITTRLIEGEFINYKQIISSQFETQITVNKQHLENALERASLLSRIGQNNLVQFELKDKNLCITSRSEIGNVKENVGIVLNGKELVIAFNARYFMDALRVVQDEFVKIKFNSPQNPCLITPFEEEEKYLYLILPMRIMTSL